MQPIFDKMLSFFEKSQSQKNLEALQKELHDLSSEKEIPLKILNERINAQRLVIFQHAGNREIKTELKQLHQKILQGHVASRKQQELLEKLDVILATHFSKRRPLQYLEQLLNQIESQLPKEYFPPFARWSNGRLIKPHAQFTAFKKRLGVEGMGTAEQFIQAAQEEAKKDYAAVFTTPLKECGLPLDVPLTEIIKDRSNYEKLVNFFNSRICNTARNCIPPELALLQDLKNLNFLSISARNNITFIPECLSELKQLMKVSLEYTKIVTVPEVIYSWRNLKELAVANFAPDCRRLSQTLEQLKIKNARNVDATHIFSLANLVSLYIEDCDLSSIPTEGLPKNLQRLELLGTRVNSVPPSLWNHSNLKTLRVGSSLQNTSSLSELPEGIENLKTLEELSLRGTAISKFPKGLSQLPSLQKLNIHGCKNLVEPLPDLPHLTELICAPEHLSLIRKMPKLQWIMIPSPQNPFVWESSRGISLEEFLRPYKKSPEKLR